MRIPQVGNNLNPMVDKPVPTSQQIWQPALLFLMLGLLLKILSMSFAAVHQDSGYYLNIGSNFIERGELTPYMWRLGADTNIIAGSGTGYGVLLLNYWFKVFGLSLLSGYIFMYLAGLLSLVVLYFLARDWWGGQAAGVGAVVMVALTQAFTEIFYIRFDAAAILAYSLILWLHLHAVRSGRKWMHFGVGVVLVAALEIHILAALYIAAISLYYVLQHYRTIREGRKLCPVTPAVYFFAGLALAGIAYLLVHILPDPRAYFLISRECPVCEPAGPLKELRRYRLLLELRGAETLLFVIALAAAYLRREKADRHYLIIVFGYFVAQTVSSPPITVMYMTHLLPLIGLGVGGAWMKGISPGERTQRP